MIPLLSSACLLALAIAAVAYRVVVNPMRNVVLVGGFIIAGLSGLEMAVVQTIVERMG